MQLTRLVFSRSDSMCFILSQDSCRIRSFSTGISAGLLVSSSNISSSLWRCSKQGFKWSSTLCIVELCWAAAFWASEGWILLDLASLKPIRKFRILTSKAINILANHCQILSPEFSLEIVRFVIFKLSENNKNLNQDPKHCILMQPILQYLVHWVSYCCTNSVLDIWNSKIFCWIVLLFDRNLLLYQLQQSGRHNYSKQLNFLLWPE